MKRILLTIVMAASFPTAALAQQVPAIENVSFAPGSYAPIAGRPHVSQYVAPQLAEEPTPQSARGSLPEGAITGMDRSVTFAYGQNLPTVICAPLHVCELSLQPGESIQSLDVGDTTRWSVKLARTQNSEGQETSHIIVKPATIGIVTNLVAITDKRTYSIQLVSRHDRAWMPKIAFTYPDDQRANWDAYFNQNRTQQEATQLTGNTQPLQAAARLDFNYHLKGDKPGWRPVRVYSDTSKTYIQLPATAKSDEIPVLLVLGPGNVEQLVNYRLDGDSFVVDKVIQKATLISGIGKNQQRVDILKAGHS